MINLPDVTLVVADTVCHDLTKLAVEDCISKCSFADVLIASDKRISVSGATHIPVEFSGLACADLFRWTWGQYVRTTHLLIIEWDSWIIDANRWSHFWLDYDYIGAPWPFHSTDRVGNGGFSLRSRDLLNYLIERPNAFVNRVNEDNTLCREYRNELELNGFVWAPDSVAARFAFERSIPLPTFGFHGLFNFKHVLNTDEYLRRLRMCPEYVRRGRVWAEVEADLKVAA